MNRIFTGTAANELHFQAYLADGICRWNAARASEALSMPSPKTRSFDVHLKDRLNRLTTSIFGHAADPTYQVPSEYTGELFGVEYLLKESDAAIRPLDLDEAIEKGMERDDFGQDEASLKDDGVELDIVCDAISEPETAGFSDDATDEGGNRRAVDSRSIDGWDRVDKLAEKILELKGLSVTAEEAEIIIRLYDELSPFDKEPLKYSRTFRPARGRFGRSKAVAGHIGQEAMKRCFVSGGAPSLPPSKSRVVEAICIRLFNEISSAAKDPYVSRYCLIIRRYNEARNRVMLNPAIVERTGLALFPINETTLSLW